MWKVSYIGFAGRVLLGLGSLAAISFPGEGLAQQNRQVQARPMLPGGAAPVDFASLGAQRFLAHDKDQAEDILDWIGPRSRQVRDLVTELRASIEIKESEIDIAKTQRDLARRQGRDAEKAAHEGTVKRLEQEKRLLERQRGAAEREIRFLEAQRTLMRAQISAFDREMDLTGLMAEWERLQAGEAPNLERLSAVAAEISELERRTLAAMEDVAEAEQRSAVRRRDFIREQLEVIKSRRELDALTPP